jgi:hypothetical protein
MRKLDICAILTVGFLNFPDQHALAQGEGASQNPKTAIHRIQYPTDGEVPNGVALRWMAKISADDYNAAMGLAGDVQVDAQLAHELVTYLAEIYESLMSARRDAQLRVGCQPARQWPEGDHIYRIWDLMDDVALAVDETYYLIVDGDLGAEKLAALQPLLNKVKDGLSVNILNHQEVYREGGVNAARENLTDFCNAVGR